MKLTDRNNIIKNIDLILKGMNIINEEKAFNSDIYIMLEQMQGVAIEVGETLECELDSKHPIILLLEELCELIYELNESLLINNSIDYILSKAYFKIEKVKQLIYTLPIHIKIAFFPYKISMWDSLESIYEAALSKENCICNVIPIPYYEKDNAKKLGQLKYEGLEFSKKVPITDYKKYQMESEKPDLVFIHNPYDANNKVVEVDSNFYSRKLKESGAKLIYVPYYMAGYCLKFENMVSCVTTGGVNSDYIVLQNDNLKEAYAFFGYNKDKLLVTGSPKLDYIVNKVNTEKKSNIEWNNKFKNKKVILLNSSIHTFLSNKCWLDELEELIKSILFHNELGLIWRPHPLLYTTLLAMRPESKDKFNRILSLFESSGNGVIDESEDIKLSFTYSSAMISDYSSLVLQYTFTNKPVYLLKGSIKNRDYIVFCDYFYNYFKEDGINLNQFLDMVCNDTDLLREDRVTFSHKSVVNTDGSCGEKTLEAILIREKAYQIG
ncbi:CDP-glycerol glycerophosphotransferase family protein [Anaerocolumna sp. AGMB13020]|uniref:CDP-glycerol glycerophosphotransferase family protein n=1 Tax=Anaerocolumna sp. AGMB13020 TaxID=3081750 RepID=UPI002953ADC7|nr:CDP-glycerol glycerophosphotransferase family protein [Anaerocolumna sp. AGMB13020]WOO35159.1 CDP-glycerol glycerophosphotransferase family protein [Anaerocolumna sp. AGMB13020]